jgi:hypothetical protein
MADDDATTTTTSSSIDQSINTSKVSKLQSFAAGAREDE